MLFEKRKKVGRLSVATAISFLDPRRRDALENAKTRVGLVAVYPCLYMRLYANRKGETMIQHMRWSVIFLLSQTFTLATYSSIAKGELLTNWIESDGRNWTLSNGDQIAEGPNTNQNQGVSLLISDTSYGNHRFLGTLGTGITNDDDFIGLAFGIQNPVSGSNHDYILIDWSKGSHSVGPSGFRLSQVHSASAPNIFNTSSNDRTIQASDLTSGYGWEADTIYSYDVTYTPNQLSFAVQGGTNFTNSTTIFNATPGDFGLTTFAAGRVGFAVLSQDDSQFTLDTVTNLSSVPEPTAGLPILLASFFNLYRRRRGVWQTGRN
ncbi:MAG: hypothetical protein AAF483_23680 [Planctomycetota bacterium]